MKLIDLTHPVGNATPVYPGDSMLRLVQHRWMARDHYNAFTVTGGLHTGTHVDMPLHMAEHPFAAADYPPERFVGPGLALDCTRQDIITPDDSWQALTGEMIPLLVTGWSAHFTQADYFSSHPTLSLQAAQFLIDRGVGMVALDIPSPDRNPFRVHRMLCTAGVLIVENLLAPERLLGRGPFTFQALPLALPTEASPVRAVALLEG